MYMNAYHKEQGEVRMFEVDARNAIARFPEEWSAAPWPVNDGSGNDKAISQSESAEETMMSEGTIKGTRAAGG